MKKIMLLLGLLVFAFLLTSCGGGLISGPIMMNNSKKSCLNYGFEPGTQAYAQCVQDEYSRRRAEWNSAADSIATAGRNYDEQRNSRRNRSLRCTSTVNGDIVYTDCR
jgi:hypothetical protein